jgi:hypothetical protein
VSPNVSFGTVLFQYESQSISKYINLRSKTRIKITAPTFTKMHKKRALPNRGRNNTAPTPEIIWEVFNSMGPFPYRQRKRIGCVHTESEPKCFVNRIKVLSSSSSSICDPALVSHASAIMQRPYESDSQFFSTSVL